ncbi:unnamed protein product [Ectocarpus sp. CCAP 1310/34]|nr:unnamed protein product [Ectocarpus sp. CCAP 1310/34]
MRCAVVTRAGNGARVLTLLCLVGFVFAELLWTRSCHRRKGAFGYIGLFMMLGCAIEFTAKLCMSLCKDCQC